MRQLLLTSLVLSPAPAPAAPETPTLDVPAFTYELSLTPPQRPAAEGDEPEPLVYFSLLTPNRAGDRWLLRSPAYDYPLLLGPTNEPSHEDTTTADVLARSKSPFAELKSPDRPGPLTFRVGRTTALRDGGIEGAQSTLDPAATDEAREHLRSFAQRGGEFDLYDISLEWAALKPGPVTFSLLGGVRAIRAEVSQATTTSSGSGQTFTTYEDARGVVAVPVLGGGLTFDLGEGLTFRTTASTQTLSGGASYLDLIAETGITFAPNVSLFAGYQFVESQLEVDRISTELDQEGLYARLQIRF